MTRHAISAGHYLAATAGFRDPPGRRQRDRCRGAPPGSRSASLQSDLVDVAGVAPIMIYLAEKAGGGDDRRARHLAEGARSRAFMREHGGKIPQGVLRTVVPAAPDAWITALRRYGTMSFGEVAAAAIRLARDGFPMYPLMAESLKRHEADHRAWPSTAAIYLPNGRLPRGGRGVPPDRPRRLVAIHGRRGARAPPRAAARPGSKRRATRSTAATSPARSSPS